MSLRYASRLMVQGGSRAAQAVRDHASKHMKDAAAGVNSSASSSSSRQIRRFTSALDSSKLKAVGPEEKRKRAEESLRTVMYLSCWGPN